MSCVAPSSSPYAKVNGPINIASIGATGAIDITNFNLSITGNITAGSAGGRQLYYYCDIVDTNNTVKYILAGTGVMGANVALFASGVLICDASTATATHTISSSSSHVLSTGTYYIRFQIGVKANSTAGTITFGTLTIGGTMGTQTTTTLN